MEELEPKIERAGEAKIRDSREKKEKYPTADASIGAARRMFLQLYPDSCTMKRIKDTYDRGSDGEKSSQQIRIIRKETAP